MESQPPDNRPARPENEGKEKVNVAHEFNNILSSILLYGGVVRDALSVGDPRREDMAALLAAAGRGVELTRRIMTVQVGPRRARPLARLPVHHSFSLRRPPPSSDVYSEEGPERKAESPEHRPLVLLVDDEKPMRDVMTRILQMSGYQVESAETVDAAQKFLVDGLEPQALICDVQMGEDSGLRLLEWMQVHRAFLCPRVLVLTGNANEESEYTVAGARFRVLPKPIERNRLLEIVGSLCRIQENPSAANAPVSERILVIEDDPAMAVIAARILRRAGFTVLSAETLAAARKALAEGQPDGVLADIRLPDGDVMELVRELRMSNLEMPIVVMTALPSTASAIAAMHSGVSEYLPKPFTATQLEQAIRTAVDTSRIARLRSKLLSAHAGNEFMRDIPNTEARFQSALQKINMHYQPIVRAADGQVYGYEALLRCSEPGLQSPLKLLAAAEALGRVGDLGRIVRASVAATIAQHRNDFEAIFVNIHPSEFHASVLADGDDPLLPVANRVVLEVTERASLNGGPALKESLRQIRQQGYRVAVDDLGEGYAGLSSLVHLRPDIAKVDMSLVRNIHLEPLKQDIVSAIVDLARRTRILVVAEGIETVEERQTLLGLGCDLFQGYLFAKPAPPFVVPRSKF